MLNNINAKSTCELFRIISKRVWDKIIFHHSVNTEVPEIGLTNDIIAILRNYSRRNGEIGIWANNGWNEKEYGSDIDVFIERSKGKFVWYAMQAKVLKINNNYDIMAKHQWEMLNHLNERACCITKFLLYSGVSDFQYFGHDICENGYHEHQFGCSLVKPDIVRILSEKSNPTFYDFHPKVAHPWRSIVCCNTPIESPLYSARQIRDAVTYYPKRLTETDVLYDDSNFSEVEFNSENREFPSISESNEEVGRTPKYAIVIKETKNTDNSNEETLKLTEGDNNNPLNKLGETSKIFVDFKSAPSRIGEENENKEKVSIRIKK